ncbi:MAG: hypothetical protein ACD_25C00019G0001, partial [uncultured bacterium]
ADVAVATRGFGGNTTDRYYLIILIFLLAGTAKLAGVSMFYVVTGSMRPVAGKGDVVITVPVRKIKSGDIVSFRQNGVTVTHRVIGIQKSLSGVLLITKGDNNEHEDPFPVSEKEILGKVVFIIPSGYIYNGKYIPVLYWLLGYTFGLLVHRIRVQKAGQV